MAFRRCAGSGARRCLVAAACTLLALAASTRAATEFDEFLKPLLVKSCQECHGGKKVKGKVNFKEITSAEQLLGKPKLIRDVIEAVDAYDMPPEDEPELDEQDRTRMLAALKELLRQAASSGEPQHQAPVRRLNRFQYNNAVVDLFQLNRDVFHLQEKLMTRRSKYLDPNSRRMPDQVEVACESLRGGNGMSGVNPFPKDLRAAHGFDNQANQLSLSPLLLDTFLKLSVSIVESPDFNERTVGIWKEFFQEPAGGGDLEAGVRRRLEPFLMRAFRDRIGPETLDRYTAYGISKIEKGLSFTDSMRKVASAVLSSPRFLYRPGASAGREDLFVVASNLSFFLWSSGPDRELLELAGSGDLAKPAVFKAAVDRMMADPKIERFLDAFPSQWMQLENALAATPDPAKARLFSLDKNNPASTQMVLEPLLLFDAVFIEDRPIAELIAPSFSYQSEFLKAWYTSDLRPQPVDKEKVERENTARTAHRRRLEANIREKRTELESVHHGSDEFLVRKSKGMNLSPGYRQWEADQSKLLAVGVVLSPWHRIGPFQGASLVDAHGRAFINEANVDLGKAYGDRKWELVEAYVDGKVHQLTGENSATYLYRTIHTGAARSLELSIGSDDGFKIWVNGKLVTDKNVTRGVAPDQDKVRADLAAGENTLLFKIANGGGGHGFYFRAQTPTLPGDVIAALKAGRSDRTPQHRQVLAKFYRGIAPELAPAREELAGIKRSLEDQIRRLEDELRRAPQPQGIARHREEAQRRLDDDLRAKMRSHAFERVAAEDPRYGGVITNAALMSMTSGPTRTHPIARGAWIIEVIFNDPPPPPPNDVPPLNEDAADEHLTIREKFARHRENPDCAGCHSRLDPLGFALENYDIVGRWRDKYENGREVDASGTLMRKYPFAGVARFKETLVKEDKRFAKAFTAHLLRFALARELGPKDVLAVDAIVEKAAAGNFKLRSLMREVMLSGSFVR